MTFISCTTTPQPLRDYRTVWSAIAITHCLPIWNSCSEDTPKKTDKMSVGGPACSSPELYLKGTLLHKHSLKKSIGCCIVVVLGAYLQIRLKSLSGLTKPENVPKNRQEEKQSFRERTPCSSCVSISHWGLKTSNERLRTEQGAALAWEAQSLTLAWEILWSSE